APIAQVSGAAARAMEMGDPAQRADAARDKTEAGKFRDADARGLLMVEIPIDQIAADSLVRDRVVLDKGELEELKTSIAASGLRLPIEVYRVTDGRLPYGLLSGYRRLLAVQELLAQSGQDTYRNIRALV